MSDPMVRHLAHQLSAMQDRIRAMEVASQAAFRSIEGGSIDVYDDETDELLGVIGVQRDGSVGVNIKTGKKPEAPTEPDVQPIPGGAIVAWDGRFEDRQSALVIDRIAVHMDETAGFTPDRDTEVAAVRSTGSGGTAVIPIDDGAEWYVKLVAVSKGGVWSDPSDEVFVSSVVSELGFCQDTFTVTASGDQTLPLSFEPAPESEHLYWNGSYQPVDTVWTRDDGQVITVLDAEGYLKPGDALTVEYAYRLNLGNVVVPWEDTGWAYLLVTEADATNRAAVGYDDSAWATGQAPFGNAPQGAGSPGESWPGPNVITPVNTGIWLRRTVTGLQATEMATVTVRVDGQVWIYWNGALLASDTSDGTKVVGPITVPGASVGATNQLAIRAVDDVVDPPVGDYFYIDVTVEGS